MIQKLWVHENRKTLVCVDSYENGVLQGRFYTAFQGMVPFDSLSQFLTQMESVLEENQMPQSYTTSRSFSTVLQQDNRNAVSGGIRQGARATFELQILFRQHSSWQGLIVWQDKKVEQSFRSVLELVLLINSALRSILNEDTQIDDGDLDVDIPDEAVPKAKAPKTGDISLLWAALSGLSAGGMEVLNRKRKEKE